ncbi:hypothetical protein B0H14DRAFT_2828293 [Mycena olivaceomarginata]|nr:hypothetical protein B0H14DRAFT_2828293 [Mycena olivaceomarginata]
MPKGNPCSLFENDAGSDPCDWNPDDVCRGSTGKQCSCSSISYVVWAACDACTPPPLNTTWQDYADNFDCSGLPRQFPLPFPTGRDAFASWAIAMVSATPAVGDLFPTFSMLTRMQPTIFDLAAASAIDTSSTLITLPSTPTPSSSSSTTSKATSSPASTSLLPPTVSSHSHLETGGQSSTVVQSVTGMSSASVAPSGRESVNPTSVASNQLLPSVHGHPLPTGAIAGIAIAVCLMISLAILFFWLRRRRRPAAYPITSFPNTSSDGAGTSVDSDASKGNDSDPPSTNAAGYQHPQVLPEGREEKTFSGENSGSMASSSLATFAAGKNMQPFAALRAYDTEPRVPGPDVVSQLREMTARVRDLEAQLESPPPEYSGGEP